MMESRPSRLGLTLPSRVGFILGETRIQVEMELDDEDSESNHDGPAEHEGSDEEAPNAAARAHSERRLR